MTASSPATATLVPVPYSSPVETLTVSGWYLRTDGSIGLYLCREGGHVLARVLPSWAAVAASAQLTAIYAWSPETDYIADVVEAAR